jgi:hypothetical protein
LLIAVVVFGLTILLMDGALFVFVCLDVAAAVEYNIVSDNKCPSIKPASAKMLRTSVLDATSGGHAANGTVKANPKPEDRQVHCALWSLFTQLASSLTIIECTTTADWDLNAAYLMFSHFTRMSYVSKSAII